jgi:hypoxanthine phosphoribosyltransferase
MTCVALKIVQCLNQLPLSSNDLAKYTQSSIDVVQSLLEESEKLKIVTQNEDGLWKINTSISENAFVDYHLRFAIDDLLTESKKLMSQQEIIDELGISKERKQEVEIMLLAGEYHGSWKQNENGWEVIYGPQLIQQLLLDSIIDTPKTFKEIMELMPKSVSESDLLAVLQRIPRYNNMGWIFGVWQNMDETHYLIHMYMLDNAKTYARSNCDTTDNGEPQTKYENIYDAIKGNPLTMGQIQEIFKDVATSPEVLYMMLEVGNDVWKTKLNYCANPEDGAFVIDTYYMIPSNEKMPNFLKMKGPKNNMEEESKQEEKEAGEEEEEETQEEEMYPCTCNEKPCSIFKVLKWELPWLGDEPDTPEMSLEQLKEFFKDPNSNIQIARSAMKNFR